ncbi:hypothetical protein AC1031_000594 [Aphanomyces cochlioides]|nr:hypothetical protein AC1031_000594 [Aphanomyces cochlioides]
MPSTIRERICPARWLILAMASTLVERSLSTRPQTFASDLAQFVDVTGVDATTFRSFLVLSCGSVGRSSFAFALLSTFFGAIAFLTSILFVICFPVKSCLVSFLKAITFGAALSSLIAFSCWLAQTKPLAKVGMHPGSCFVIEILACACFLGAYVAMNHHAASESIEAKSID